MLPRLVAAAAVVLLAAGAATASTPRRVIQGDRSVGPVRLGRATAPDASVRFRDDGVRRLRRRPGSCLVTWPRIGLGVDFGTIGGDPANPCRSGVALVATVTSRAAWRTALSLRVGDSVTRLRRLYGRAALRGSGFDRGWWLVPRHACAEVGGAAYPGLLARVRNGRVAALVARVGVCD